MTENPATAGLSSESLQSRINTRKSHAARIWNYWLGGADYYEVDRQAGDRIRELHPAIDDVARADRLFLGRAVRHLVTDCGIRQFLDIGTGLPTADNTHEVAQRLAPDARIVYVDNDPLVLAHARALLTSTPQGRTDHLDEDLRNVDAIFEKAARTLDFSQPVGLMLLGVVIFIEEDEEAYAVVRRLLDALPSGSHLAMSHTIVSPTLPQMDAAVDFWNENGVPKLTQRTPEAVARFFGGLDVADPGVISCSRWRPECASGEEPAEVGIFGGVGRKP